MGIDRTNVRFVIHYGQPKTIETYYKQSGRADRDGKLAECFMFADDLSRFKWIFLCLLIIN